MADDVKDGGLFNVIAVEIADTNNTQIIAEGKTKEDADAIVKMAVYRRGCETHFYTTQPQTAARSGGENE